MRERAMSVPGREQHWNYPFSFVHFLISYVVSRLNCRDFSELYFH